MADKLRKDQMLSTKGMPQRRETKAPDGSQQGKLATEEGQAAGEKDTAKPKAVDFEASDQSNDSDGSFQVVSRRRKMKGEPSEASSTTAYADKTPKTGPVAKSLAPDKQILRGKPKQTSLETTRARSPSPPDSWEDLLEPISTAQSVPSTTREKNTPKEEPVAFEASDPSNDSDGTVQMVSGKKKKVGPSEASLTTTDTDKIHKTEPVAKSSVPKKPILQGKSKQTSLKTTQIKPLSPPATKMGQKLVPTSTTQSVPSTKREKNTPKEPEDFEASANDSDGSFQMVSRKKKKAGPSEASSTTTKADEIHKTEPAVKSSAPNKPIILQSKSKQTSLKTTHQRPPSPPATKVGQKMVPTSTAQSVPSTSREKNVPKEEPADVGASDPSNDSDGSFQMVSRKKKKAGPSEASCTTAKADEIQKPGPAGKSFAPNKLILQGKSKQTSLKTTHARPLSPLAVKVEQKLKPTSTAPSVPSTTREKVTLKEPVNFEASDTANDSDDSFQVVSRKKKKAGPSEASFTTDADKIHKPGPVANKPILQGKSKQTSLKTTHPRPLSPPATEVGQKLVPPSTAQSVPSTSHEKDTTKEEAVDLEVSDPSNDSDGSFQMVTRKKKKVGPSEASFTTTYADQIPKTGPAAKSFAPSQSLLQGKLKQTPHPRPVSPPAAREGVKLAPMSTAQSVPSSTLVKEQTNLGTGNVASETTAEKSVPKCPWAKIPQKPPIAEPVWPAPPVPSSQPQISAWGGTADSTNLEENLQISSTANQEREPFQLESRQLGDAIQAAELVHSPTVEQISAAFENVEISEKLAPPTRRINNKIIPNYKGDARVLNVITIEVNYLPLKIKNPQLNIYHYDVAFIPDKPIFLLRPALEKMRQKYFKNRYPAFDGRKNMYVAGKPLRFPRGDTLRDTVEVSNEESGNNKSFDIAIKCVNTNLNMNELIKYTQTGITGEIPQSVIQATDIALRCGLSSSFTTVGRSFFADPRALDSAKIQDLTGGLEIWPGIYQSAVMAWKPYVNVDVANKAFPKQQTILQFMKDTLTCTESELCEGLSLRNKEKLQNFLKGLKIEYRMPSSNPNEINKRNYKIVGLGRDAESERFQPDGNTPSVIVYNYYKNVKNYQIKYPKLPLLIVGSKGALVPIERCSIISNQVLQRKLDEKQTSNMVRAAARPTDERKMTIIKNICHARYSQNPTLNEFEIEVGTEFEKVQGIVMKPPEIAYNKTNAQVRDGVWKMDMQDRFSTGSKLRCWGILTLDSKMDQAKAAQLADFLQKEGPKKGIEFEKPSKVEQLRGRISEDIIYNKLLEYGRAGLTMVLVIMTNNAECYGMVKRASELRSGVLTQCLKLKTLDLHQGVIRTSTIHNILLKMNTKLRGINHYIPKAIRPEILQGAVMIVGADVTHPASDSRANTPSIAAVAASHDSTGFQYNMMYRLQHSKQEMIEDLADIMKAQLESFKISTGVFPSKILFFRDGVSEGQFQTVLNIELNAVRRGCAMANPKSKIGITLVVVQKRHHTRFFPHKRDGDGRNNNVPAGTLVNTTITHPTEIDFYLVSHQSIQGTARPTKYHLLWDDNCIPEFELQRVTFYLCHLFSRCTRAVSYPAPTYYAHLAAFRARAWWDREDINMSRLHEEQEKKGRINQEILDKHPMFFI